MHCPDLPLQAAVSQACVFATFEVAGVVIRPQWTSSDGHDYSRMTYYPRFAPARQSVFEPGLSGAPDREYPAVLVEQSI
jgi:hypothetical protein